MMNLKLLITLLPLVFMFHDFEEIIFFKPWLRRNKEHFRLRFPRIAKRVLPHLDKLSISAFALAVAEEFILISAVTYAAVLSGKYTLWFAVFAGFSLHIVVHIVQWMVYRRYLPTIVTSVLVLPYCLYTFNEFARAGLMDASEMILWALIGLIIVVVNLLLVHRLAERFDRWSNKVQID